VGKPRSGRALSRSGPPGVRLFHGGTASRPEGGRDELLDGAVEKEKEAQMAERTPEEERPYITATALAKRHSFSVVEIEGLLDTIAEMAEDLVLKTYHDRPGEAPHRNSAAGVAALMYAAGMLAGQALPGDEMRRVLADIAGLDLQGLAERYGKGEPALQSDRGGSE
jgi:hypothetical protein